MFGAAFDVSIHTGNSGVIDTLKIMRRMVREYRRNPLIIETVHTILAPIPAKQTLAELSALLSYVQNEIRYTQDVNEVEVLQTPVHLLETRQGDCDDMSTLLATLLEAAGYSAKFVAVGFDRENLSHVLVAVRYGADWMPLESTEPVNAGWFPPNVNKQYELNI